MRESVNKLTAGTTKGTSAINDCKMADDSTIANHTPFKTLYFEKNAPKNNRSSLKVGLSCN